MSAFTHLHLHTQYSLLDGAIRVKDLFPKVLELGMDSVAVTDHGNMFGAVDLYTAAREHGVKMIFGCETYIAASDRFDRTNRRSYHMVLLAKDQVGYKNLSFLNSMGYLEGFYYNPRIDKKILREHSEGLIGMSACLGGEVAQTLLKQGTAEAEAVALEYQDIFGKGNFYLEMMGNQLEEQQQLNADLKRMSRKLGIPLVATNDCHYVSQQDAHAHEILLSIQTGKTTSDDKRLRHTVDSYFLKNAAEMEVDFSDVPEAMENTVDIARRCNVELDLGNTFLPNYKVPEGMSVESYLEKVVFDGLERRFRELSEIGRSFDPDQYRERLRHELGVINKMGFPGYFLIVWDFINWAKEHNIPVGPGRGSGAGSCVAWAMRITDIDPLEFKLLFERFLNPERVSMPDFDVDFCMNRRDEVIDYVKRKYGEKNVGQIATFHQLKARGVIRDIARVMELPYAEADKLAKLVPDPVGGKSPPVRDAIEQEPELKRLYNEDPKMRDLLDVAASLEGLNRHVGMHAAGVVIAEDPLWEYVPCFRGQNGEIVTQFAMKEAEKAGLVKFDFLGLKTLTVIHTAVRLINEQREAAGEPLFDIDKIDKGDPAVYKMISRGDTTGVFQLESSGFREILTKLKPDQLEDIVAAVALYRPGPLEGGMVDDFIERKHGRKRVEYPHPDLEPVLRDTYGVIVYQEQVMQIAQVLAGYSLGRADLLRRAMGKKNKDVMAKEKDGFVTGATERGVDSKLAEQVFDLMAFFAGYGFNRSHSAAYGWISYQTAYLKHHYPHEFMAGLMSCDQDNTDNIVKFIAEARAMGLVVARPDVNESAADFTVVVGEDDTKRIRFGLGAVKGVGQGAVEAIIECRNQDEKFISIYEFCRRVDSQKCNRRVIEALVKSGAFDGLSEDAGLHRARVFATIEAAMESGAQAQRDRRSGQTSLFGLIAAPEGDSGATADGMPETYPEVEEWPAKELLAFEKESLGFYISGHPLDRYRADLTRYANATTTDFLEGKRPAGPAAVGGVVSAYRERPTRKGDGKIAFFQLEDATGQLEVIVFPKTFERVRETLVLDEPILCSGKVVDEGEGAQHAWRMLLEEATPLAHLRQSQTSRVDIHIAADQVTPDQIEALEQILTASRGSCQAVLHLSIPRRSATSVWLDPRWNVAPSEELLARIERLFGAPVATLH
ncbi:DNA polymerase III subunit alpha [Haliangium ochraceum]|uniref:DNA polymerase III subunit alpha n=1 Tax=Haliangium ochraceum (strain DSM 14365 / JCM 11303 / SMP-2) TaxID=502025 RepID=D0LJI6_HALO1|nr:DNA polymerase III subunit alpha [Haliangium ochraceum]ACY16560.1 DNA polymerase III, alpha subunit [Haliangium ochraceum DSM 14365]